MPYKIHRIFRQKKLRFYLSRSAVSQNGLHVINLLMITFLLQSFPQQGISQIEVQATQQELRISVLSTVGCLSSTAKNIQL